MCEHFWNVIKIRAMILLTFNLILCVKESLSIDYKFKIWFLQIFIDFHDKKKYMGIITNK